MVLILHLIYYMLAICHCNIYLTEAVVLMFTLFLDHLVPLPIRIFYFYPFNVLIAIVQWS